MEKFAINSIYLATEGEGIRLGEVQLFIRFQGCNIGCINCDSKDTWEFLSRNEITFEQLWNEMREKTHQFQIKNFSITGGDPLHPKNLPGVFFLAHEIKRMWGDRAFINVEASGTRICEELFSLVDFISFDYKTPSTGVKTNSELIKTLIKNYSGKYQIKSVIENEADFLDVVKCRKEISDETKISPRNILWCLTPAYNNKSHFPQKRFENLLLLNQGIEYPFRVIGQQHKWVFGPDIRNV